MENKRKIIKKLKERDLLCDENTARWRVDSLSILSLDNGMLTKSLAWTIGCLRDIVTSKWELALSITKVVISWASGVRLWLCLGHVRTIAGASWAPRTIEISVSLGSRLIVAAILWTILAWWAERILSIALATIKNKWWRITKNVRKRNNRMRLEVGTYRFEFLELPDDRWPDEATLTWTLLSLPMARRPMSLRSAPWTMLVKVCRWYEKREKVGVDEG